MNKLKFYLVNYKEILRSLDIVERNLEEYLNGGRQDIMDNFDIFCENVRSKPKKVKNFNLFERVDSPVDDVVIVLGLYLELLEFWGERGKIYDIVKYYCSKYPTNKIVVQWNHDLDALNVFHFINEFKNLYVLNFNTSVKHERFIILPFWSIDDGFLSEEKKYLSNLVCSFNSQIRINLKNTLMGYSDFYISERVEFDEYKKILSKSKFTFCPKGNGLSSYRFFECFHLNTIPVLFADNVILPYEEDIDYNNFIVKIEEAYCSNLNYILEKLNSVNYEKMLFNMNTIRDKFTLKGVQEEVYKQLK